MTFSRIADILVLLLVGYSQCELTHDCSHERIVLQMMTACMNKRSSVYGQQMLIRKHRIDENYPRESEELDEKEILGIGQDIPTERKEIPKPHIFPQFYHQNQQQYYQQPLYYYQQPLYYYPQLPHYPPHIQSRFNMPQTNDQQSVIFNHQIQQQQQYMQRPSTIFPGLTYESAPSSRPPPSTEAQHQYETYYSTLNTQQKRMLRTEYAHVRNLVMQCCLSNCNENHFKDIAC